MQDRKIEFSHRPTHIREEKETTFPIHIPLFVLMHLHRSLSIKPYLFFLSAESWILGKTKDPRENVRNHVIQFPPIDMPYLRDLGRG